MDNCFKKLFHLQGLKVSNSRLEGKKMIISCEPKKKETKCHSCGRMIKTVRGLGYKLEEKEGDPHAG